jgi:hypothetical protein
VILSYSHLFSAALAFSSPNPLLPWLTPTMQTVTARALLDYLFGNLSPTCVYVWAIAGLRSHRHWFPVISLIESRQSLPWGWCSHVSRACRFALLFMVHFMFWLMDWGLHRLTSAAHSQALLSLIAALRYLGYMPCLHASAEHRQDLASCVYVIITVISNQWCS